MQNNTSILRVMFIGDLMGHVGQAVFARWIFKLKEKHNIDAIIVNGENAAKSGKGITPVDVEFLQNCGVQVITTGNHIWQNKKIYSYLSEKDDVLRPANYPSGCPGKGYTVFEVNNHLIGVINVQGRSFIKDHIDCPLRTTESLIQLLKTKTNVIFVDFHAETTAEKQALGLFLDGMVSGVFGTHTHVQTSDERILPQGTAYITDAGFCGAYNSVIGMKKDVIIEKFLTQMPHRFEVEKNPPYVLNGVWVEVDTETGKALNIERIRIIDEKSLYS
jgi:metallophosphoesterase (TIGR00282 family)